MDNLKEEVSAVIEGMQALRNIIANIEDDPQALQFLIEIAIPMQKFIKVLSELTQSQIQ